MVCFAFSAKAQNATDSVKVLSSVMKSAKGSYNNKFSSKSAIYFEILGNSVSGFSINYDRIIKEYRDGYINITSGFGFGSKRNFNIPLSINYTVLFPPSNHHLEFGVGTGINFIEKDSIQNTRLLLTGRVGYKYQRPEGGFYLRAGFTPVVPLYYLKDNAYYNTLFGSKRKSKSD